MIYTIGIDALIPRTEFAQCDIQDVVNYCKSKTVLGVDTETDGFDFTCKKMIMFQIERFLSLKILLRFFTMLNLTTNLSRNGDI